MKISDSDLRDILVNSKLNSRGQYICDCPFCGKESHFYISKSTQLWDCKKCGETGNIFKLLKFLDKTYLLGERSVKDVESISSIRNSKNTAVNDSENEIKLLPKKLLPAGWRIRFTRYLKNRGLTKEDCEYYRIGSTDLLRKYNNYVIIPVVDNGEIRGWVGRYGDAKVPDDKKRYLNSEGVNFSELLFGYDEICSDVTTTVIIVEGIFDKIAVDRFLDLKNQNEIKCVCTFGKKISDTQIKKLIVKKIRNVIMLYDFDAVKDTKKFSLELSKLFNVMIVFTTKKDIDCCTKEEALEVFSNQYKPDFFNENIIGKLKK